MTLQCTDRAPHQKVQQRYRITYTSSTEKHTETNVQETAVPGIGDWTVQYFAMRVFGWPDAFPYSDLGILKALKTNNPRQALAAAESWRPWRAYAAMHLWKSLEKKL